MKDKSGISRCSCPGRIGMLVFGSLLTLLQGTSSAAEPTPFRLLEATIPDLQRAMEEGTVTSERLVRYYLNRIEAYEDKGPAINAILTLNPNALAAARALDEERRASGPRGPLHGIPILLKDNYDTFDVQTTAACRALEGSVPPDDAFVVGKLREAGAVILAKANMDEFCVSCGAGGVSSLGGQTRNPYDLTRSPGFSSGGVAAAIAAGFAAVGMGSDTGGSIRGPASAQSLVGLLPTFGLASRDGLISLVHRRDHTGPMARSVVDAAIVLGATAGPDPADPATAASEGHVPASYLDFLDAEGLRGARIGVAKFPDLLGAGTHPEFSAAFDAAVADLEAAGADVISPIDMTEFDAFWTYANAATLFYPTFTDFHYEVDNYLESLGPDAPMHSVEEIFASKKYIYCLNDTIFNDLPPDRPPEEDPNYPTILALEIQLRERVLDLLDSNGLDALVYVNVHDKQGTIAGASPTMLVDTWPAVWAGLPAIAVPAGFTGDGFPVGIEFLGRAFSEGELLRIAYAYEQATRHRRPPPSAPFLDCNKDGVPDEEEIATGTESDVDIDGIPDGCEPDCNSNALPDDLDIEIGTSKDCNANDIPDECDIASGRAYDCNSNGLLDECEVSPFPAKLAGNTTGIDEVRFLGPPDGINEGLGGESVTYDLGPGKVVESPGPDFNVYEGARGAIEFSSIDVLVSGDGISFTSVKGTEGPLVRVRGDEGCKFVGLGRSYDLGPSGLAAARYIRILGLKAEPAGEGRGFDLDAVGVLHLAVCPPEPPVFPAFRREDPNADGTADISDAVFVLGHLFLGTAKPTCEKAADTNDDGKVDVSDPVFLLGYLFLGSKAPGEPLGECGTDPTEDDLPCQSYLLCR